MRSFSSASAIVLFGLFSSACGSSTDTGSFTSTPDAASDVTVGDTTTGDDTGLAGDSGAPGDTGTTPGDAASDAAPAACTTFAKTTIAAMRAGKSGCYELDAVVSIALTPSTKSPKLYVQDAAGGPLSAIVAKCSSTSMTHPCTVASAVAAIPNGHAVTITGDYVKSKTSGTEEFFVTSVTDAGAAATVPAPAQVGLSDVQRDGKSTSLWFQKVTLNVAAADALKMYDWSPAEFASATATACPYQFGFGMIPSSVAGVTAGMACSSTTAQPAGVSSPNAAEVLVGSDFYKTFTVSSDCRCAAKFMDKEPTATSTVSGSASGILVFEFPMGATSGFQYLAPLATADFPITNTQ